MGVIGCEVCHRVIYETDGPICVYCRPPEKVVPATKVVVTEPEPESVFAPVE